MICIGTALWQGGLDSQPLVEALFPRGACAVQSPSAAHTCPPPHLTVWICGVVQTALYGDFFWYYYKAWKNNERLSLPA